MPCPEIGKAGGSQYGCGGFITHLGLVMLETPIVDSSGNVKAGVGETSLESRDEAQEPGDICMGKMGFEALGLVGIN